MSVWDFLIVFGVGFVVGVGMGMCVCLFEYIKRREEAEQEEELKELEARIAEMQGENPDELSLLLMKEQRLAYEAEEERAKKRAAGAGVKSNDESFRENNGDV